MNQFLFYDSLEDALEKAIIASGKTKKEIASVLYPDCQIETAKSRLSRALSPEHADVNISIGHMKAIMNETRPDDIINFLCDEFGFERPIKKTSEKIKKNIQAEISEINSRLKILVRQLPALEDDEKK
ncbi:MAG: hypothetical protein WC347_02865 [Smithellaceae bacterium]